MEALPAAVAGMEAIYAVSPFFVLRHVSAVIIISYLWVRLRGLLPRAEKMVFVLAWRRCFITFAVYGRLAL